METYHSYTRKKRNRKCLAIVAALVFAATLLVYSLAAKVDAPIMHGLTKDQTLTVYAEQLQKEATRRAVRPGEEE